MSNKIIRGRQHDEIASTYACLTATPKNTPLPKQQSGYAVPSSPLRQLHNCTKTVLAIPDWHHPFAHPDSFDFLAWMKKKFRPDTVVNLGDEADYHAISFHDHDPDGYSPGHELTRACEAIKPFFALFPEMYLCNSNHGDLPYRKAYANGLPARFIKSKREILCAPASWKWADRWDIDGIIYEHGDGQSGQKAAVNAAEGNQRSTVIGHVHSYAGLQYVANAETLFFGFNVGCLVDTKAYAFRYGKHFKRKPVIGAGLIERGVPRFVPMLLDKRGRWIRRN